MFKIYIQSTPCTYLPGYSTRLHSLPYLSLSGVFSALQYFSWRNNSKFSIKVFFGFDLILNSLKSVFDILSMIVLVKFDALAMSNMISGSSVMLLKVSINRSKNVVFPDPLALDKFDALAMPNMR